MKKPKKIAIYGKGGIGKSTTSSNISAALAEKGYKVIQVGCDPKSDSTNTLRHGKFVPSVLDTLRSKSGGLNEVVHEGYGGILCVEAGGPEPGVGCAGRGIIAAIELLNNNGIIDEYDPDVVIYDVLGDVVCGGFAMPIRQGVAEQVYAVTSSDFMALYAANNLFKGILKYANNGGALLGGIIGNSVNNRGQQDMITDFGQKTSTEVIENVPRSPVVTRCELDGMTTIEGAPDSKQAEVYRRLARNVIKNDKKYIPESFNADDLMNWGSAWVNHLLKEQKVTYDGIQDNGSGL